MGWQRDSLLRCATCMGQLRYSPSSAILSIFQKKVDVGPQRIIRCVGMKQQGVARHGQARAKVVCTKV